MSIPLGFTIEDDDSDLLGRFTAWMEQVVVHAAADYIRRQGHRQREVPLEQSSQDELSYEDPLPAISTEFDFAEDKLSKAFSGLNLTRRRVLTLIFVEGLSAQETADKLGCSVDYIYLQKHRALKTLRDQLMDGGDKRGE
jgi:RNA polymerase sigma factor (sigma-70 family)